MQTETVIRLRQVRGVGGVLNDTFRFLRQNYAVVGKSLLFIVGPVAVVSSVSGALMQVLSLGAGGAAAGLWAAGIGVSALLAVVLGLATSVLTVAVVYGCVMLYEDYGPQGFGVRDVWAMAKTHFWTVLGALLVVGFLLFLPIVIVLVPCLGAVAYGVGVAYFGVAFSLLFPMLIREQIGLFDGMTRCMNLVKGVWWPTFAVLMVAGLVYLLLGSWVTLPYYAVIFLTGLHSMDAGGAGTLYSLTLIATGVVASLGGAMLNSIPLTAVAFQFFNLVERKERVGQFARVAALLPEGLAPTPVDGSGPQGGEEGDG